MEGFRSAVQPCDRLGWARDCSKNFAKLCKRCFCDIDRVFVTHGKVAGLEHAVRLGQVQHVDEALRAVQVRAAQHRFGDLFRLVAEDEDASRIGEVRIEASDKRNGLDGGDARRQS